MGCKKSNKQEPQVLRLTELQPEAGDAGQQQLMSGQGGSVMLAAFPAGLTRPEHSVPHLALAQVIEGKLIITVEGAPYEVETGEALLIPPGAKHFVHAPVAARMVLSLVKV